MKTRTFIAVALNDQLRAGACVAIQRLRGAAQAFRWVAKENLHYTLHFLGDLTDTELVEVCQRVADAVAEVEPFTLGAQGVGAFPSADRPRTLWIGAHHGAEQLIALHQTLDDVLADLGFRGENRKYVPHLTIGKLDRRSRGAPTELADEMSSLADFDAGTMRIDEVTVFSSHVGTDGPEYQVLSRAPLRG